MFLQQNFLSCFLKFGIRLCKLELQVFFELSRQFKLDQGGQLISILPDDGLELIFTKLVDLREFILPVAEQKF